MCMRHPLNSNCDALFLLHFWSALVAYISAVFCSGLGTSSTSDTSIYDVVWKLRSCLKPSRCTLGYTVTFENRISATAVSSLSCSIRVTSFPNMASISVFGTCIVRHLWTFTSFTSEREQRQGVDPGHAAWAYRFLYSLLVLPHYSLKSRRSRRVCWASWVILSRLITDVCFALWNFFPGSRFLHWENCTLAHVFDNVYTTALLMILLKTSLF